MKKIILFTLSTFIILSVKSQDLEISQKKLDFGIVYENELDSQLISLRNTTKDTIKLVEFRFYNIYNSVPFKSSTKNLILAPSAEDSFYVYLKPFHNIIHNTELFVITNPSIFSFSIDLIGQGKYSKTYYNATENKSEEDLKSSLKALTALGYVSLGYNGARDKMFMEIDNQKTNGQGAISNTLECVYTGRKATGYTDRSNAQTSFSFNTEHTFPQSTFSQNEPMRSDIHHLFPTDDAANNSRSNYAFGVASLPYVNDATNFPSHLGSNTLYEPRNEQKGRVARAMMYFVLRYQDYSNFFFSQEAILRQWNSTYPPNEVDLTRNAAVQVVQKNRNPFVDYPQFAERIQKLVSNSNAPIIKAIDFNSIIYSEELLDTSEFYLYQIPIINSGNTNVSLTNFNCSLGLVSLTKIIDTLNISKGESENLEIKISCKDTSGIFADTIKFSFNGNVEKMIVKSTVKKPIINSISNTNSISKIANLYPNPVKTDCKIQTKYVSKIQSICLIDIFGKSISLPFTKISENEILIDLRNQTSGVYTLFFNNNREFINPMKLIKE